MKRSGVITVIVIGLILVGVVAAYFINLNHKSKVEAEMPVESTPVQKVLQKDLERNYPHTPKEVVKYYAEITKCFYNEDYTEDELEQLAFKIQELYDAELVANKSQEDYLNDLRTEIADMKNNDCTITGYVYCTFSIKRGTTGTVRSMEQFVLRKDEDSHWKILGWELVED